MRQAEEWPAGMHLPAWQSVESGEQEKMCCPASDQANEDTAQVSLMKESELHSTGLRPVSGMEYGNVFNASESLRNRVDWPTFLVDAAVLAGSCAGEASPTHRIVHFEHIRRCDGAAVNWRFGS
jgi:hypothetical protein